MADLTIHAAEDIELEQLDGLALDDAADGVPSNDDKLDVYAEWIFSDERDAWLAAEALGEKREARASKRLQDTSEAQALAEKVIERVAREATASVIQAVRAMNPADSVYLMELQAISIYTFLSNQWIRLCPLFLTLRYAFHTGDNACSYRLTDLVSFQ